MTTEKRTPEYYQELATALSGVLPLVEALRQAPGGELDYTSLSMAERRQFYLQLYGFMFVYDLFEEKQIMDDFTKLCLSLGMTDRDFFRLYLNRIILEKKKLS